MDLYFSPLAGSLAARIALYEAGAEVRFIEVDPKTKRTSDGSNFAAIFPLGLAHGVLHDCRCLRDCRVSLRYLPANRQMDRRSTFGRFFRHAPSERD